MNQLNQILKDLHEQANANKPRPAIKRLKKGLRIMMKRDRQGLILGLARDDVYPSTHEWNTVLSHMPYQVPLVTPRQGKRERRFYLTARIPDNPQPTLL